MADLHLDSPVAAVAAHLGDAAERVHMATFAAFDNGVRLAVERHALFLIVAGDAFDCDDASLRAQRHLQAGFQRLHEEGIPVFVAFGNHDPGGLWLEHIRWPESAHFFGADEPEAFDLPDEVGRMVGISHGSPRVTENLAARFPEKDPHAFTVAVLHCNVGTNTGHDPYAPCEKEDLSLARADYWALGHIHKPGVVAADRPLAVYPGNPQGRNRKEAGARGCTFVEVVDGVPRAEQVPLDIVRHVEVEASIEEHTHVDDLLAAVAEACRQAGARQEGRDVICRITLIGSGPLSGRLARPEDRQALLDGVAEETAGEHPAIWPAAIEARTAPQLDLARLREADSYVGMLLRTSEDLGDAEAVRSLVAPLYAKMRTDELAPLTDDQAAAVVRDAEALCARLLASEEAP
jgi:exonuclease SbcD